MIILTRNHFDPYQIDREMVVTGRNVIMGNPLTLPLSTAPKSRKRVDV